MKTISFVCDTCGKPLPEEFIMDNGCGGTYFNLEKYNRIVDFSNPDEGDYYYTLQLEYIEPHQNVYAELCPKCRLEMLKRLVSKLEEQEKENK